jgi:hypothetical protein
MNQKLGKAMPGVKFPLGQLTATPGALHAIQESGQRPWDFLSRHMKGDWGEVCGEDWALNNQALLGGSRLLSAYKTLRGKRLWVITEADRSATTILLPDEY